jgi:hypothetical protein
MEEAAAIATLGYDTSQNLIEQLEHYARFMPLQDITPLSTCTVMLRDHSNPIVQHHGDFWWAQILAFTRRDQMSFDFSCIQTNCHVEYWAGTKHDNDLVHPQDNFSHQRVLANFDEKRYLWHHQTDPQAVKNPKKHYLASNPTQADAIRFSRRDTDPLNLFCHLFGSSLGSSISPRRRVTEALYGFVSNTLDPQSNVALCIHVCPTDSAMDLSHEDFLASCKAFQAGFNIPNVQTVVFKDQDLPGVRHPLSRAVDVEQCGLVFVDALGLDTVCTALPILLKNAGASLSLVSVVVIARGQVSLQSLSELGLTLSTCLKKSLVKTQIQEVHSDHNSDDRGQTLLSLAFDQPA